jgi:hypothetical protein
MGAQSMFSPYGHSKHPSMSGVGAGTLKLPVSYVTADAAVLYTVPAGHRVRVARTYWENTTAWTGGSSSAIGASSSNAGYSTKGDIQGGASGDLTAAMGAGFKPGTIGAKFGSNGVVILTAGDTIIFDRIASVYTAGAGYLCVELVEVDNASDS